MRQQRHAALGGSAASACGAPRVAPPSLPPPSTSHWPARQHQQFWRAAAEQLSTTTGAAASLPFLFQPRRPACSAVLQSQPSNSNSHSVGTDALQHNHHPYDDIEYVLFSEQQIQQRVHELGRLLAAEYRGKAPLVLGVLTGAFQFTGDLVRAMQPPPRGIQVNFVRASSYGSGTTSSGQVKLKVDIAPEVVEGRHVLLVEDIVDTGLTLTRLRSYLLDECKAASCCIVTLLDKKERRKVPLVPDHTGFECPNEFVVGYGLDMDEEHRTLPFIGVLKPSCYAHKS